MGSSDLLALPGYFLLLLLVAFPMVLQLLYLKALLFGCMIVIITAGVLMGRKLELHLSIMCWTLSLAALSLLLVLRGFFAGTPGAVNAAKVFVIWPIVYTILIAGTARKKVLGGLQQTLVVASIVIALHGVLYLLDQLSILPQNKLFDVLLTGWEEQSFGFHEGYLGMQYPGLNSLPFLIPFLVARLVCRSWDERDNPVLRIVLWTSLLLGLGMVLMSGRRALIVVTLLSPILVVVFSRFQPLEAKQSTRKSLLRLLPVLVLATVVFVIAFKPLYDVNFSGLFGRVTEGFDFRDTTVDEGAAARHVQYAALLHGWFENPIFGAGYGASAYGSIRSEERPWEYELFYMALLYQTGLFGFFSYAAGVVWMYWVGAKVIKQGGALGSGMLALLVGMSTYLIANSVDPYLGRFDGLWAIFLPLTLINYWLSKHGNRSTFRSYSPTTQLAKT